MEIIDAYLKTVKLYLPRTQAEDILTELADEIYSQKEEKENELARPLNENEIEAILRKIGDPIKVASKYRDKQGSVVIGKQLISPELFPYYIALLLFNAVITIGWVIYAAVHNSLNITMILVSILIQFTVVTLVVIIIDFFKRKFPGDWIFTPSKMLPLTPIPSWKSVTGLVSWLVFGLWWLLLPRFQFLLFGTSDNLTFTPGFLQFHLPILILLLLGIIQRTINISRPDWTLLPPVTRFITNLGGLVIIYLMIKSYPYVTVTNNVTDSSQFRSNAIIFNAVIYWGFVVSWLWIFFLANLIGNTVILFHFFQRSIHTKNNK